MIDFSYFLKQNILTPHEYSTLLSKFTNDLRVINGRLLYYTDAYYRALSSKVEMISTMQNNIDALHAQLEADVISPVTTGVRKPSLVDFTTAYQTLFTPTSTKTPVLNYKELVADYFEKYLNAEQKFLKNVYAFREYFNSLVSFSGNFIIYDNDISATLPVLSNQPIYFLGLDKIPLAHGAKVTYQAPVYKKLNNGHFKNELLVNETNYQNFYVSAVGSGGFNLLADLQNYSYNYNSNDKYYLTQTKFQELFPNQIGESTY